jgi:hypothetical protein
MAKGNAADLRALVDNFVKQIVTAVESATSQRIQAAVAAALSGASVPGRRGRPPKNALALGPVFAIGAGKPRAKQLCPVPGCKNPAAPVFGMVCAEHKDVSKAKIKEYREARRKAKVDGKGEGRSGGRRGAKKEARKAAA